MDTWLIVSLVVLLVAALAGTGLYLYRRRRQAEPVPELVVLEAEPLGYTAGGASYMITLGIGTPAEISAFILFGLAANPGGVPAASGARSMSRSPLITFRNRPGVF